MEAREEAAFTQQRQQNETVLNTLEMLVLSNQRQEFRRRTFHHDQRGRELKEIRAIGIFQPLTSTLWKQQEEDMWYAKFFKKQTSKQVDSMQ